MSTATRQHLPPCCHGVPLGKKDTPKVRFKTELAKYATPTAKKDALPRLASALTDARSALCLDRTGADSTASDGSKFNTMEDIQSHLAALGEYLSLVKGFTVAPVSLLSDAKPPLTSAQTNPVATVAASSSMTPQAALLQPLIENASPPATMTKLDGSNAHAAGGLDIHTPRTKCLSFCNWRDVLTNANSYAPNARLEYAQTLLASALAMMNDARARVDTMLAERLTEINESELKVSYQLFLHGAGVLDACLKSLDRTPQSIGAQTTDLSALPTPATSNVEDVGGVPDEDAMEKWRQEQRRVSQSMTATSTAPAAAASVGSSSSDDFALLSRVPDLANGRFIQLLSWIALAQAQELVILRGISRDFVDYALMAKLSIDVALRYKQSCSFAARHLPAASSPVASRLQLYCAFKDAYYTAVSCYFQGAACMEKEDGNHCAQAIADFKKAAKLIQESNARKARYDATAPKDERDRQFAIKTVYVRAEQIIQRDLEIVTRRNDSVYYERIPEPQSQCEPLSLVKAVEFPSVEIHALWHDADIATCLQPTDARTGGTTATTAASSSAPGNAQSTSAATATQPPRKDGCCSGCAIM